MKCRYAYKRTVQKYTVWQKEAKGAIVIACNFFNLQQNFLEIHILLIE